MLVLIAGTIAIALWIDVRFERLRPRSLRALFANAVVANCCLLLAGSPLDSLLRRISSGSHETMLYVLAACALLTYGWLVGLWLVRSGAEVVSQRRL
jgi:hypothetical protein